MSFAEPSCGSKLNSLTGLSHSDEAKELGRLLALRRIHHASSRPALGQPGKAPHSL